MSQFIYFSWKNFSIAFLREIILYNVYRLSVSADMEKSISVIYRYRPIRKLDISVIIGIGRYGKIHIIRTLTSTQQQHQRQAYRTKGFQSVPTRGLEIGPRFWGRPKRSTNQMKARQWRLWPRFPLKGRRDKKAAPFSNLELLLKCCCHYGIESGQIKSKGNMAGCPTLFRNKSFALNFLP